MRLTVVGTNLTIVLHNYHTRYTILGQLFCFGMWGIDADGY